MPQQNILFYTENDLSALEKTPSAWTIPDGAWIGLINPEHDIERVKGHPRVFTVRPYLTKRLVHYDPVIKKAWYTVWEKGMKLPEHSKKYAADLKQIKKLQILLSSKKRDLKLLIEQMPTDLSLQDLKDLVEDI